MNILASEVGSSSRNFPPKLIYVYITSNHTLGVITKRSDFPDLGGTVSLASGSSAILLFPGNINRCVILFDIAPSTNISSGLATLTEFQFELLL